MIDIIDVKDANFLYIKMDRALKKKLSGQEDMMSQVINLFGAPSVVFGLKPHCVGSKLFTGWDYFIEG